MGCPVNRPWVVLGLHSLLEQTPTFLPVVSKHIGNIIISVLPVNGPPMSLTLLKQLYHAGNRGGVRDVERKI